MATTIGQNQQPRNEFRPATNNDIDDRASRPPDLEQEHVPRGLVVEHYPLLRLLIAQFMTREDYATLIGLMIDTFARVSAAVTMDVKDVYRKQEALWVRLHEKGGKHHEMPCQHNLKEWLQEYIEAAGIAEDPNGPLFRTVDRKTKQLGANRLDRQRAWAMVKRRAKKAGIDTPGICNHTFRGTGITAYLESPEAKLEHAQQMAAHSDPKTTRLYDRRSDQVSLDEVERIGI